MALALVAAACRPAGSPRAEAAGPELTLAAASDLRFAMPDLTAAFTVGHPATIRVTYGSSGHLVQQVAHGAPIDVLFSANLRFVDDLGRAGHCLLDTSATYARGFLVAWTRDDAALRLETFADVVGPDVARLAIANPDHAPYGTAARQALVAAGLWTAAEPRVVIGEDVSQTFQLARSGNVDVAIVALALARATPDGRHVRVPEDLHDPLEQGLCVVASSREPAAARALAAFVLSSPGQAILARHGFGPPGDQGP